MKKPSATAHRAGHGLRASDVVTHRR
jgi:hypothetical protein